MRGYGETELDQHGGTGITELHDFMLMMASPAAGSMIA
jgi:hypothetical protein